MNYGQTGFILPTECMEDLPKMFSCKEKIRLLENHFAFQVDTDYATYRGRMVSTGTWDVVFGLWDCG